MPLNQFDFQFGNQLDYAYQKKRYHRFALIIVAVEAAIIV